MATIKNIYMRGECDENKEIRIDWDNDRHQAISIGSKNPGAEDVIKALIDASVLLEHEKKSGNI